MPAGLVDIVSYGTQDLFLTGVPQITFFRVVYRRYTNFASESYEVPFDDTPGFGQTCSVIISPNGDLISKMYLKIKIPEVLIQNKDVYKNWTTEKENLLKQKADAFDMYKKVRYFTEANINAYRAACAVYAAENVKTSYEILNAIIQVFQTYQRGIEWFNYNTPIPQIKPSKFNLLVIAKKLLELEGTGNIQDPDIMDKEDLKVILDIAVDYNKIIQKYYEDAITEILDRTENFINPITKFAWVDKLAHSLIDYIDISIGGERIDRAYGMWLNIWYELAGNKYQEQIYYKMIGNVPELTTFDKTKKPSYTLYVPLQFWFNKFNGLAIPLVGLQYHDLTLTVKLRKFQECAYVENLTDEPINLDEYISTGEIKDLEASLLIDYVYLSGQERKRMAQSSHEYLIEQVQVLKFDNISNEKFQAQLDLFHPCKELIWVVQKDAYTQNKYGDTKCRWDNYTASRTNTGNPIRYSELILNGHPRFSGLTSNYYNYVQPYDHHSNTPSDGINVYSFGLKPEEFQPNGTCNFSRINKVIMNFQFNPEMFKFYKNETNDSENSSIININEVFIQTNITLYIFVPSINILRIMSGLGALAYV